MEKKITPLVFKTVQLVWELSRYQWETDLAEFEQFCYPTFLLH